MTVVRSSSHPSSPLGAGSPPTFPEGGGLPSLPFGGGSHSTPSDRAFAPSSASAGGSPPLPSWSGVNPSPLPLGGGSSPLSSGGRSTLRLGVLGVWSGVGLGGWVGKNEKFNTQKTKDMIEIKT